MMLISKTYKKYTPDPDADFEAMFEDIYDEEDGFIFKSEPYTFREVVELMQTHNVPSSSRTYTSDQYYNIWLSDYGAYSDTVESIEQGVMGLTAIHFCNSNPERSRKYWFKAMKAAGLDVNFS